MEFENEDQLQEFIADYFDAHGDNVFREVSAGGGRCDVVTNQYAIEVKPTLTRSAIFQAAGQLGSYKADLPGKTCVIAGLLPSGERSAQSAINTAERCGYEVWFVNHMQQFQDFYDGSGDSQNVQDVEYTDLPDYFFGSRIPSAIFWFGLAIFLLFSWAIASEEQLQDQQVQQTIQQEIANNPDLIPIYPYPNAQKPNGYVIMGRKLDLIEKGQEWSKIRTAENHYSWIENKYITNNHD